MGVKFAREYNDILKELTAVIKKIEHLYSFFEMDARMWNDLAEDEKEEYIKTIADDIFYALGTEHKLYIVEAVVEYDVKQHRIVVLQDQVCVGSVDLV